MDSRSLQLLYPKNPLRKQLPLQGCHRHFKLPKRIGGLSGHGRGTGKRQISVLAPQKSGNKVIHAEGEAQAAEKLAEAANIISVFPAAIHLRFLQTITKAAAEKNSTTILPLPIDLLTAFLQRKEKE